MSAARDLDARYALGLDVGGTFTDVVLARLDQAALSITKTASVPEDPARGFFDGIERIMAEQNIASEQIDVVLHGSTVATNAILEGKWSRTGMLVTDGFKYVLEIGRAEIPRRENLYAWVKPRRPVAPRLIFEVAERVKVSGEIARPLDEDSCRTAARSLAALELDAVAVVFLHSYANSSHERRAARILREELPGIEISLSCDVLPVFREYERAMATVLNAAVQPRVGRYVGRLRAGLHERGITAPLLIMKSNGGVFTPAQASLQSIEMALSGPAAGAQGAAAVGAEAGCTDLITLDMGGTSADVCLIRDAAPTITVEAEIASFPLSIPTVDIHTIGAGGGSIAQVDDLGRLRVGPQSAGASPGPACYPNGGDRATVTDANLVLGRIPPHLLDGRIELDFARAAKVIERDIGRPLGLELADAARGIVALVNNNMVGALKVVSVERGYDPADFSLCALGGAGPVHAGEILDLLGAAQIIVPRFPGILCAIGLLSTDQRYDFVQTCVQRAGSFDPARLQREFDALIDIANQRLEHEQVAPERRRFKRAADLRYERQGVELKVPIESDSIDDEVLRDLVLRFHQLHQRLYTFSDEEAPVELINLRVEAIGTMTSPPLPELAVATSPQPEAHGARSVLLESGGHQQVPLYRREALRAGHVLRGPAVVDQLDTTTVVLEGQQARVDRRGNLLITRL